MAENENQRDYDSDSEREDIDESNLPLQHDYIFPGFMDAKATGRRINETINRLEGDRVHIFNNTAFKYWSNVPKLQGDPNLVHAFMLKEVRPDAHLISQERLRFKIGTHELSFGREEFCLITGFKFGFRPNHTTHIPKVVSTFRQRVFPETTDSELTVGELHSLLRSPKFSQIDDEDAVRVCLLYILLNGFMGREISDKVTIDWLSLAEDLGNWNRFAWGSFLWTRTYKHLRRIFKKLNDYEKKIQNGGPPKVLRYSFMGFIFPFKIWIWEMLPAFQPTFVRKRRENLIPRMCVWQRNKKMEWNEVCTILQAIADGVAPKLRLRPKKSEIDTLYYKQFIRFSSGERSPPRSPPRRKKCKTKDGEDSTSTSTSSARSLPLPHFSKARGASHPDIDPDEYRELQLKVAWLTKQIGNTTGGEDIPPHTSRDNRMDFARPFHGHENTNEMFYTNPIREPEARINTNENCNTFFSGPTTHKREHVVFTNKNTTTPIDHSRARDCIIKLVKTPGTTRQGNPSYNKKSPFIVMDSTRKAPKHRKNRLPHVASTITEESVSLPLLLEPYMRSGYVALGLYLNSVDSLVFKHRSYNYLMDHNFWNTLYGKQNSGYLEEMHIVLWSRLLLERCPSNARWTIVSTAFFDARGQGQQDWIKYASGCCDEPERGKAWWDVDCVFFPIHVDIGDGHWVLGELWLDSFTFAVYDSLLEMGSFAWLRDNGHFAKCEEEVRRILGGIDYWSRKKKVPMPVKLDFINYNNVPQQGNKLGDCGVFLCMFLEQLISGLPVKITSSAEAAGMAFRYRMANIYWGSRLQATV